MTKIALKKELANLDNGQLRSLILDLYSARKEAKEYLDFFANPDLDALTERYRTLIAKEFSRGKYAKSTARISRIRTYLRDYASFGVPAEAVIELMDYSLRTGLIIEQKRYVSSAFASGMKRLAADILKYGDKNLVFDSTLRLLNETLCGKYGYRGFVNQLRTHLEWSAI